MDPNFLFEHCIYDLHPPILILCHTIKFRPLFKDYILIDQKIFLENFDFQH